MLVTNQSVIGREMITKDDLHAIHAQMNRELSQKGVGLDSIFFCPVVPTQSDQSIAEHLDRKPGPGLLWHAARELGIDVSRFWMVGDQISDVSAGRNAGCRGSILIDANSAQHDDGWTNPGTFYTVTDLCGATDLILRHDFSSSYCPKGIERNLL